MGVVCGPGWGGRGAGGGREVRREGQGKAGPRMQGLVQQRLC